MSSNALDSQGMTLDIYNGSAFVTIPEVMSISGPGGQSSEIDVTDLSSTAKEFRMGLQDEGSLTLEMSWIPTNVVHKQMRDDRAAATIRTFEMFFTDLGTTATKWAFSGFIQGLTINNGVDGVTSASVSIRISGQITQTDAT